MVQALVSGRVSLDEVANDRRSLAVSSGAAIGWEAPESRPAWSSRPSLFLEQQRAALELAELLASPVYYGLGVPRGDRSPVLLLPGFLGSDDYLAFMRGWLQRIGYRPHSSRLGLCTGPLPDLLARALRRVESVARTEDQPLTLVGHSLGGIISCAIARQRPDLVAHVITLGSAICDDPRGASHPMIVALADMLGGDRAGGSVRARQRMSEPRWLSGPLADGIRLTCIYSREDAVVDWRACMGADYRAAAYEVRGTHSGLAWNAAVYRHLGRQLATT